MRSNGSGHKIEIPPVVSLEVRAEHRKWKRSRNKRLIVADNEEKLFITNLENPQQRIQKTYGRVTLPGSPGRPAFAVYWERPFEYDGYRGETQHPEGKLIGYRNHEGLIIIDKPHILVTPRFRTREDWKQDLSMYLARAKRGVPRAITYWCRHTLAPLHQRLVDHNS